MKMKNVNHKIGFKALTGKDYDRDILVDVLYSLKSPLNDRMDAVFGKALKRKAIGKSQGNVYASISGPSIDESRSVVENFMKRYSGWDKKIILHSDSHILEINAFGKASLEYKLGGNFLPSSGRVSFATMKSERQIEKQMKTWEDIAEYLGFGHARTRERPFMDGTATEVVQPDDISIGNVMLSSYASQRLVDAIPKYDAMLFIEAYSGTKNPHELTVEQDKIKMWLETPGKDEIEFALNCLDVGDEEPVIYHVTYEKPLLERMDDAVCDCLSWMLERKKKDTKKTIEEYVTKNPKVTDENVTMLVRENVVDAYEKNLK